MTTGKAIVTGGLRGIGLAITKALLARRVEVVAITRHAASKPSDLSVTVYELDLADPASVDSIVAEFGDANILINNAGHLNGCSLDQYDTIKQQHIPNLNLITPVNLMWRLGQLMANRGGGRIVNNASVAAHIGHPDFWYGATKAGLLNATKSMARAMGQQGIICNAVAPGPTQTDMLDAVPESRKTAMKSNSIMKRFAQPEEIAEAVSWLALDSPAYINGACIDINNGAFMR